LFGTVTSQNEGFAEEVAEAADIPVPVEGVVDDMLTALRDRVSNQSYISSVFNSCVDRTRQSDGQPRNTSPVSHPEFQRNFAINSWMLW
jgi:hypothetical protein